MRTLGITTVTLITAFLALLFYAVIVKAEFISPAPALITIPLEELEKLEDRVVYLEKVQRAYKRLKRQCRK